MENNTSQNQGSSSNNTGNSNKSAQQHGSKGQQDNSMLTMLHPQDMSRTVESALHVFQGNHEKLPELMQDVGQIILKASRRFSTTQLILTAGVLTIGAIMLAKYSPALDEYEEAA